MAPTDTKDTSVSPVEKRTWSGFDKSSDYFSSLKSTPKLFAKRAFYVRHPEEQMADKEAAHGQMKKCLNWFHVMALGTGMIIGAGIFVSTGAAAQSLAGPAVVLSFLVAGISALLSALCYSEFAAEFPLSGGAYNYISMSLGEMAAWLVVTTLILEYILAGAAVSRAFSAYFATLIGKPTNFFTFPYQSYQVDFLAAGLVVACCVLLIFTTAGGFACVFALTSGTGKVVGMAITGAVVLILSVAIHLSCHQFNRPAYRVPFFPYAPAASLLLNCFLMASLPANAFWQLGLFFAIVSIFYVLYSIHAGTFWEKKQGRGVLATTTPPPHRPDSLRVLSSFKENPSVLMPYRAPSHFSPMQGRWSGGVVRLPAEY